MTSSWKTFFELLGGISAIFAVIGGLYAFYAKIIFPRTTKAKLQKLNEMITTWFDEIDKNLNSGLNMDALNNQEVKMREFICRNLKNYWIKPTKKIIREWNKPGTKKEFIDSTDLFSKTSRVPVEGIPLEEFYSMLIASFYKFHANYSEKTGNCNFAEVEMPVKFFRFYVDAI